MTQLRYSATATETLQRAATQADLVSRQSRDISKLVKRLARANTAIAIEQPHQQAVFSGIAHLAVLHGDLRHRMKRLEVVLKNLNAVGRLLRPSASDRPLSHELAGANVVSLTQRRLKRHGAERLVTDIAARLDDLCEEIGLLNQTIEAGLRSLSDLIHR